MQALLSNKQLKKALNQLTKFCAYSYIYTSIRALIKGEKLSEQGKTGRSIALLGIFCPLFWYALFTGADPSTLAFHATHSSLVFLLGMVIMIFSFKKK